MAKSAFHYVTYIRATPERLWFALTDAEFMKQYWFGNHCESRWTVGSAWKNLYPNGQVADAGEIVEVNPPRRMVFSWHHQNKPELRAEGPSICAIDLEPFGTAVKLTITQTIEQDSSKLIESVAGGWPKVIANLKSLLENGHIALQDPYPVPNANSETK